MNLLKLWLRILLHSKMQRPFCGEAKVVGPNPSCFGPWIRAYRQRLDAEGSSHVKSSRTSCLPVFCLAEYR
jgi:hypothetical protein